MEATQENAAVQKPAEETAQTVISAERKDPFDEGNWGDTPAALQEPAIEKQPEVKTEPIIEPNPLKDNLGFDDWEAAKTEVETLRKLRDEAKTPEEVKFANDESKRLFEAIKEGKEDDVFSILDKKRQLTRAEKMDLTKASDAAEILKLNLQYKHKDLTADEVDYLFKKQFSLPTKPSQKDDQTDEEYAADISNWNTQVAEAERGMIIEAKLAKPELAKYQSELVLPDIPREAPKQAEPTPEELAEIQERRAAFIQEVNEGLNNAKGFSTTYKDKEVEIPIAYEITSEDKAALKPIIEAISKDASSFFKRWNNADGTLNSTQMAEDLYLLENKGKIFQKFANEGGAQRLEHQDKIKRNIDLTTTPQQTFAPNAAATARDKLLEQAWSD